MCLILWNVQAKEFWLRGKDLNLRDLWVMRRGVSAFTDSQ